MAERHRPECFAEAIAHPDAVAFLKAEVRARRGRSVLLHGPQGCGKTVLGEIYARALLCREGEGEPCGKCEDCLDARKPGSPWSRFDAADLESNEQRVIANAIDARGYARDDWRVVSIDDAHRLSERAFAVLHTCLEPPPLEVTFILMSSEPERIPERVRHALRPVHVPRPSVAARRRILASICACPDEGLSCETAALEELAHEAPGGLRGLIGELEVLATSGSVTRAAVRALRGTDGPAALHGYVAAVAKNQGLAAQMAALNGWDRDPDVKVRGVESFLADLFGVDILHLDQTGRASALTLAERAELVAALRVCGARLGLAARPFFRAILQAWRPAAVPETAAGLLVRVSDFDELINGQAGLTLRADQPASLKPRRAYGSGRPTRRAQALGAVEMGQRYLSRDQVGQIWEAGSFLMQMHGQTFDARICLRYSAFADAAPKDVAAFVTALTHEMGMVVADRVAKTHGGRAPGDPDSFHWIYVHRQDETEGRGTDLIATLPVAAGDIEGWLRSDFVASKLRCACSPAAITVDRWPVGDEAAKVRRHWRLVRDLCGSLMPTAPPKASRDAATPDMLIDALKIEERLRRPLGERFTQRQYGPSRTLAPGARETAAAELPVLSALETGAWPHLDDGWELRDHTFRLAHRQRRVVGLAKIKSDWPEDDALSAARRSEQEQLFDAEWRAEGLRNRPGIPIHDRESSY
ncbi:AAA family ATPase [Methylobacterium sp. J-030]|uniref:AAA family ATPase n=1 Tax=Methylobacterium sp. J-030 TaxID=2836627 RepID=UPI001FBBB078|nr:AAA family ATPase [Methylobacterium sp. J-030]MCJ2073371.1 AAA family ATPase [Methylobacterium sp. J-030]